MRLGLFTTVLAELNLEEMLQVAGELGLGAVELSAKVGRGLRHFDPVEILNSESAFQRFTEALKRNDLIISQLNCSCNPVSPDPDEVKQSKEAFETAFRLAEKLQVDTICSFSGCPGGGPEDRTPNWVVCPWPPVYLDILKWQWEERLIPFWSWAAERGAEFGVNKLAIEMHPGFSVYNPETLLKLRAAVGPAIGANFDPSHLVWQGVHIPEAIRKLKGAIWHFHAKDTFVDPVNTRVNGILDTKHYGDMENRAWTFRTVGYGLGVEAWKEILSTLRMTGYDGTISIEHEDMLMSKMEGLSKAAAFLKSIMCEESPDSMWWA